MHFHSNEIFSKFYMLNKYLLSFNFALTLARWRSLSYRNQSIDLLRKSVDWFLHDRDLRHERVSNSLNSSCDWHSFESAGNCSTKRFIWILISATSFHMKLGLSLLSRIYFSILSMFIFQWLRISNIFIIQG